MRKKNKEKKKMTVRYHAVKTNKVGVIAHHVSMSQLREREQQRGNKEIYTKSRVTALRVHFVYILATHLHLIAKTMVRVSQRYCP